MIPRITLLTLLLALGSAWAEPRLVSPSTGTTLEGSSVQFTWTGDGLQVFQWHLALGSTLRGEQIYSRGFAPGVNSVTVNDIPTDGTAIFGTLFYLVKEGNAFRFFAKDYNFSTPLPAPPALTSPSPGTVFQDTSVTLQWADRGTAASNWRIQVGTTVAGTQYKDITLGANARSTAVDGLPADGSQVWVRLSYFYINVWRHLDYQYTAKITSTTPVITSPGAGGTISTVPFVIQWSPSLSTVSQWQVLVGSAQGGSEILDTGELAPEVRSATVAALPDITSGDSTIFWISLRYRVGDVWEAKDTQYVYDPNGDSAPQIFSPPPGNEIVGAQAEFQWTPKLADVAEWWIYVGLTVGDDSIFNQSIGTASKVTVNNLPTDGQTIFVRLFYRVGESWNQRDHIYTTRRLPKMTFPSPGTLIAGPNVNLEWNDNGVVGNAWAVSVGRTKGGTDLYESGTLVTTQRTLTFPLSSTIGGDIWVRLWHLPDSLTWSFADFLYEAQGAVLPSLLEPTPGSSFAGGATKRFHFAANNTTLFAYWVYVGTIVGGRDIFNSGFINNTQTFVDVTNLPNEDRTINVRLWWLIDVNRWQFADYTLRLDKAINPGIPEPGGTITPPAL
ncbi:MAG: hypothetical protein ACI957_003242 [Verrucomicrobiales bacterium]|jgi:hypothetical protein